MFDYLNAWKNIWHQSNGSSEGMPITENEPRNRVPYPYTIKKVSLSSALEIAYIDEGPQTGEVLLFLHGMGGGIPIWEKNIDVLKQKYRCLALDLPGHGYSIKGDFAYTMDFYRQVVFTFMQALGLNRVTLVGHSMGGQISLLAALKEPTLVERLILVSPAGIEPYTSLEKQTLINLSAGVIASGNAFTKNSFNYLIGFCNNQEEAGELLRRIVFYKADAAIFGKTMLRSIEAMLLESLNHELHRVTQPCLVLVGQEDRVSPYQYLRGQDFVQIVARESAKLRHGKLVVVPQCGHFAQYQKPQAFNQEALAFLKDKVVA